MDKLIWIFRLLVLVSFIFTIIIIFSTSPYADKESLNRNFLNILLFYLSFFVFFFSLLFLIFFRFRKRRLEKKNNEPKRRKIASLLRLSFRQGFLVALGLTLLLFLQSFKVLTWWVALLVGGALLLIELYFLSEKE